MGESELAGCAVAPMNRGRLALVRASPGRDPCHGPPLKTWPSQVAKQPYRWTRLRQAREATPDSHADRPCDSRNTKMMHALAHRSPALLSRALCRQCRRSLQTPAHPKVFAGKPRQVLPVASPALIRAAAN